jgi:type II secretory pathway component PulC
MTKLPGLKNRLPRDPTKSITVLPAKQADVAPEIDSKPVSASSPAPKRVVSRPVLTINGIAFQDGGNENLAVINGITVSSGALIEGVLVEEIQKDRVRFSQSGEKFEIILNKTNR